MATLMPNPAVSQLESTSIFVRHKRETV